MSTRAPEFDTNVETSEVGWHFASWSESMLIVIFKLWVETVNGILIFNMMGSDDTVVRPLSLQSLAVPGDATREKVMVRGREKNVDYIASGGDVMETANTDRIWIRSETRQSSNNLQCGNW